MANMEYVRRNNIAERSQQFLTSYDWEYMIDFQWFKFYHPPMEVLRKRTKDIDGGDATLKHTILEDTIRGFRVHQPGFTDSKGGTVSITFADFEDQSIKYWYLDWQNKMDSLTTHAQYRKEDLMVDVYLWRLNSNRQKVWEKHFINCLPQDTSYGDQYEHDNRSLLGKDTKLTLMAEMIIPTPLMTPLA